jgi:hypothetical protein
MCVSWRWGLTSAGHGLLYWVLFWSPPVACHSHRLHPPQRSNSLCHCSPGNIYLCSVNKKKRYHSVVYGLFFNLIIIGWRWQMRRNSVSFENEIILPFHSDLRLYFYSCFRVQSFIILRCSFQVILMTFYEILMCYIYVTVCGKTTFVLI